MRDLQAGSGGGSGGSSRNNRNALPFIIQGETSTGSETLEFNPTYIPQRIQVSKERELVRHANFCGLEDVFEIHGKNREIHLAGIMLESELSDWADVVNWNNEANVITPGLKDNGMIVRVVEGEREGPVSFDPHENEYQWEYSLDLVSTGESEQRHIARYNEGIISSGGGERQERGQRSP